MVLSDDLIIMQNNCKRNQSLEREAWFCPCELVSSHPTYSTTVTSKQAIVMLSGFRLLSSGMKTPCSPTFQRWFAKIYGFKQKYPELYQHVHSDSKPLFENSFVGSKQLVKWTCSKGPDHIWESELGGKIKSFEKTHKCMLHVASMMCSHLFILSRTSSLGDQFIGFEIS